MTEPADVIWSFGGRQFRLCYRVLYEAVTIGVQYQPECPQMKDIWYDVCRIEHTKPCTVAKALTRALEDLWQYGDMERIIEYYPNWKNYRPTPKEFIFVVSRKIWMNMESDNE